LARDTVFHAPRAVFWRGGGGTAFDLLAVHIFVDSFSNRSSANAVSMLDTASSLDACRPAKYSQSFDAGLVHAALPWIKAWSRLSSSATKVAVIVKHPVSVPITASTGFASSPPLANYQRGSN